ncbi:MAG: hypothetical protein AB1630_01165 [bacterium]
MEIIGCLCIIIITIYLYVDIIFDFSLEEVIIKHIKYILWPKKVIMRHYDILKEVVCGI